MNGFITTFVGEYGEFSMETFKDMDALKKDVNEQMEEFNKWEDDEDQLEIEDFFNDIYLEEDDCVRQLYIVVDGENSMISDYKELLKLTK